MINTDNSSNDSDTEPPSKLFNQDSLEKISQNESLQDIYLELLYNIQNIIKKKYTFYEKNAKIIEDHLKFYNQKDYNEPDKLNLNLPEISINHYLYENLDI